MGLAAARLGSSVRTRSGQPQKAGWAARREAAAGSVAWLGPPTTRQPPQKTRTSVTSDGGAAAGKAALDLAIEAFERRLRTGADDPFTRYYAACAYALRGEAEPALDSLERAAQGQRLFTIARARIEPALESLRSERRFQELVGN